MPDAAVSTDILNVGEVEVPYHHGYACTAELARILSVELADRESVLLVVDVAVQAHADALIAHLDPALRVTRLSIDATEGSKTLGRVESLMERAVKAGIDRRSCVFAMGGGLVGNIAGMVAALLYRGLPLVHLPTTPVAAFDSVLSAKQAVNLPCGKNLCGTFVTPSMIVCDLAWLETVPDSEMVVGLAEMAKNVLAVSPDRADAFITAVRSTREMPEHSLGLLLDIGIATKAPFLKHDPKESAAALVFEYGHTAGHAIEFASEGTIQHGEAVAWGMLIAAEVAQRSSGLGDHAMREHLRLTNALGISPGHVSSIEPEAVLGLIRNDNKRGYLRFASTDQIPMVLLEDLGRPLQRDGRPLVAVDTHHVEDAVRAVLAG